MTPEALAKLHALSFEHTPRPWSAEEFAELLRSPSTYLLTEGKAFALVRQAGPEIELLTIAVPPAERRKGKARALLSELETTAQALEATVIILEVACTNSAARALYAAAGYRQAGHRKDYYALPKGQRVSAFILRKTIA